MGKNILIVDDEEEFLELIKNRIEASGYQVRCATSGLQALKMVRAERPDLVLLDVCMPMMDGFKLYKYLKKFYAEEPFPIILMTAKGAFKKAIEISGITDVLLKPFNSGELISKISHHIQAAAI